MCPFYLLPIADEKMDHEPPSQFDELCFGRED